MRSLHLRPLSHRTYRSGAGSSTIDTGRLTERTQPQWNPKTQEWQVDAPQVRVTVKGLQHLHQRLTAAVEARPPTIELFG